MDTLKIIFYSSLFVACFLLAAVLIAELLKFTKLIPFILIRAKLWILSLFLKKSATPSPQTGSQFTGILTTLDITLENEIAQPTKAPQSYSPKESAKKRKRGANGRFLKN
jgi:hypothetical protein